MDRHILRQEIAIRTQACTVFERLIVEWYIAVDIKVVGEEHICVRSCGLR